MKRKPKLVDQPRLKCVLDTSFKKGDFMLELPDPISTAWSWTTVR